MATCDECGKEIEDGLDIELCDDCLEEAMTRP